MPLRKVPGPVSSIRSRIRRRLRASVPDTELADLISHASEPSRPLPERRTAIPRDPDVLA